MLLIVEGPNYTGKTYLSSKLSWVLEIPTYKTLVSRDKEFQSKFGIYADLKADLYLADLYNQTGVNLISERSLPSGWVYETVTPFQKDAWESMLLERGGVLIVYLTASADFLYKRGCLLRNSDRGFTKEQITSLSEKYEEYMNSSRIPVLKFDVENAETVLTDIIKEIKSYGFNRKR